ncbi:hypothetical protein FHS25_003461 [Rhizobium laguerreae]|uniref:Uncharacterized protein n=1 Tax=Rhizobium laguerreae TaxID=1076926 RepID=A0ABR6G9M9_9HYPH|nr:hypothetical protein [Rhizobium laguerreae]OOO43153.1 hypothetical protein BS630_31915 [Rhizobium laguerreae]
MRKTVQSVRLTFDTASVKSRAWSVKQQPQWMAFVPFLSKQLGGAIDQVARRRFDGIFSGALASGQAASRFCRYTIAFRNLSQDLNLHPSD